MAKVVGIDLGTTNSVVAFMEAGKPVVITNTEGARITPSVVAYTKSDERLVGQLARRQGVLNPENTIYSAKRFIGRRYDEVENERSGVSFEIVEGKGGEARIQIPQLKSDVTPEEISAMVLQKLKADAEQYLGEQVDQAVVTVPAYFNDSQRQATKNAGTIAGLDVIRIVNEPTAASLAYGFDKQEAETIVVWDLGGGTFDVSILEVGDGVFEVKATNGDTHLGGDDYDQKIVQFLADEFKREQGIDLREDRQALQRLVEGSEKAKIELSASPQTEISLPFVTADQTGPKHLTSNLSRAKFEELTSELTNRMVKPFQQALKDAAVGPGDIDEVILVGGSTRMPAVQELVTQLTGREPSRNVNPDEVVASGAAIQAAVITGEVSDVVLLDVTPLSLGVETLGGVSTPLIERNTTIPTSKSETFSTAEDGQTAVDVNVLQGERSMAADNMALGRFRLEGIPAAPRGVPQVEVTFDIDVNGIVNVTAKDLGTGKEQKITIEASTNLSKEQVDSLVEEAGDHADEDKSRREKAESKNQADSVVYQAERMIREDGEKISDDDKEKLQSLINDAKPLLDEDPLDFAKIESVTAEIQELQMQIGQQIHQDAAEVSEDDGNQTAAGSEEANKGNDVEDEGEVVDAEFSATDDES